MQTLGMTQDAIRIRPRERRGDRTRAKLVEAALAEFREHGFERASIARIARAAGVSRPTFYFHFPKKEDLLRELIAGFEADIADRAGRAGSAREALEEVIRSVLEIQAAIGDEVFAEMLRAQTRAVDDEADAPEMLVLQAVAPLFVAAAAAGELRGALDPERAANVCLASLFGCLLDPERTGRAEDLRALVSLFFEDTARGNGAAS